MRTIREVYNGLCTDGFVTSATCRTKRACPIRENPAIARQSSALAFNINIRPAQLAGLMLRWDDGNAMLAP